MDSRWLEREADIYALEITGDALAFVSSMEKLGDLNMANKTPNKIIEFFYVIPPLKNASSSLPIVSARLCEPSRRFSKYHVG